MSFCSNFIVIYVFFGKFWNPESFTLSLPLPWPNEPTSKFSYFSRYLTGRWVYIISNDPHLLTLSEVKVFGSK